MGYALPAAQRYWKFSTFVVRIVEGKSHIEC